MWCLVLGVAACTPLPKEESSTDTAVTRQRQVEERLLPAEQEPSRPPETTVDELLKRPAGPPATPIEWVEKPESPHPKFSSDWRVLMIDAGRLTWQRVPIYGAIQDWHH